MHGTLQRITSFYSTADGASTHDYEFEFIELAGGEWRVYILRQPSYCGRSDDAHATHRLSDNRGRYICWSQPIRSLDDAYEVAALWADANQRYRRTGVRF